MRVLVIGAGGVGGAFAAIIARRKFVSKLIIADVNLSKARAVALSVASSGMEVYSDIVDASSEESVYGVAQRHNVTRSLISVRRCLTRRFSRRRSDQVARTLTRLAIYRSRTQSARMS